MVIIPVIAILHEDLYVELVFITGRVNREFRIVSITETSWKGSEGGVSILGNATVLDRHNFRFEVQEWDECLHFWRRRQSIV